MTKEQILEAMRKFKEEQSKQKEKLAELKDVDLKTLEPKPKK